MAVKIELKRSAVPGRVPTTSSLNLGELALNTYDGKVYLKQDNGTASIIELGSASGSFTGSFTGSLLGTASYAIYAETSSYANNFFVSGTLTAQTIIVQTISSSIIYSSGSNIFGNSLSDTQRFTGSVSVTGSLAVNGSNVILTNQTSSFYTGSYTGSFTGSLFGTASSATTASYALTASYVNPLYQTVQITGSTTALALQGSGSGLFTVNGTAGRLFTIDDSLTGTLLSVGTSASSSILEVFSTNLVVITGSLIVTNGVSGSFSGSFQGNGSGLTNISASSIVGLNLSQISTGSITASVDVNANNLFLIKSGSNNYFNIAQDSSTTVYSNLFVVKNFTTQQSILTVSESILQLASHSSNPTGPIEVGSFYFTATDLYIGLE